MKECLPCDLKRCKTPFYKAYELYGLNPNESVTFDRKDAERYWRNYRYIGLYFWVTYVKSVDYGVQISPIEGVWFILFEELVKYLNKEHFYKNRIDDTRGNSKSAFVVDLNVMNRII